VALDVGPGHGQDVDDRAEVLHRVWRRVDADEQPTYLHPAQLAMRQTGQVSESWAESYMGQLRTLAGDHRTLIMVGARCVVRDDADRILLVRRSDNGAWSLPAGSIELGETMRECAIRVVREETGLVALAITPFALHSIASPVPNMFGHIYQTITLGCRVDRYAGTLERVTDETTDAGFFAPDAFPDGTRPSVPRALADLARFEATGEFALD
jgi:ADP-ribose pyrophosphatase YjhB (NUDIX family)